MMAKGIAQEFAERVFEQIRGFGEYGFPESHAASFALIAYATAWLKLPLPGRRLPAALLNAQPMGFYTPATIVEDAKRHGVEVRPVDVQHSDWDCLLETGEEMGTFPIRMGLRYVRGLGEGHWERIERARIERASTSVDDFVRRTRLDEGTVSRLAEAGAFDGFDVNRRGALWRVKGLMRTPDAPLSVARERTPQFADLDAFDEIGWDYRATGNSPRGHPSSRCASSCAHEGYSKRRRSTRCRTASGTRTRVWSSAASVPEPRRAWSS